MKIVKKLVLAAVVIPFALGATSALAFGGKDGHKGGKHGGKCEMDLSRMMRKLDLSDAQKDQLKQMREMVKQERKQKFSAADHEMHMAERRADQDAIQSLLLANTFDAAKANELAKKMVEKQAERRVKMLEKQHQMLSVLTAEQKAELIEMQNKRVAKCSEKMQEKIQKRMEKYSDN